MRMYSLDVCMYASRCSRWMPEIYIGCLAVDAVRLGSGSMSGSALVDLSPTRPFLTLSVMR